jgi:hypothetical protein
MNVPKAKDSLPVNSDVLATSGLSGKSITGVSAYKHGSVGVIEITFSTGSQFFKMKQGQLEIGGTNEWGTGTIV